MKKYNHFLFEIFSLLLVLCFILPARAMATMPEIVHPNESAYLGGYSAYCYCPNRGQMQVWFDVTGTNIMDDIGALSIELYESSDMQNWTWVESFVNGHTPGMLGHNNNVFGGHVTYQAKSGRWYKAKVCVWAGRNGGGDRRYFWADPVKCR